MVKYILVSGGVVSGVGKGLIASSVGVLLKSCGWNVTAVGLDPYLGRSFSVFIARLSLFPRPFSLVSRSVSALLSLASRRSSLFFVAHLSLTFPRRTSTRA